MSEIGRATRDQEVYVLRADRGEDENREDVCLWKVGRSRCCNARLAELQTGCPYPLYVHGATRIHADGICPMAYERAVHKALASYARRGEWFECTSEQLLNAWIRAWAELTYECEQPSPYMDAIVREYMANRRQARKKKPAAT